MIILENEELKAVFSKSGAELREVFGKKTGLNYMWNGDSTYWGRVSPVLFPIVGRLKRDQYKLDGKSYHLSQHGFLRDVEFSIHQQDADHVSFVFESSDAFLDVYPYRFQAVIHYTLSGQSLNVRWEIHNKHNKKMYFSIGAHPAFNVPLSSGEKAGDYTLTFTPAPGRKVTQYELVDSLVREKDSLNEIEPISIQASLFQNDAFIYSQIDRVSLTSSQTGHGVDVNLTGFPFVGIWSSYNRDRSTMAPFVCIEPWYGIADTVNTTGNLNEKMGINELEKGGCFEADYTIAFI
ncbi:aldose 1-epimerase family protein [Domibacillus indicus]|uniref:aldose 1-epimerase family protein n=1 Tax=Domibacillus indicus TaxID=1437523 RepID=UPI000617D0B7|nr:aldose 1-epimerase family protein [Domibacillus indicus]